MRNYLQKSIEKYPEVKFEFSNPINAARNVLNLKANKINLNLEIAEDTSDILKIKVNSNNNNLGLSHI